MAAVPIILETSGGPSGSIIDNLAGLRPAAFGASQHETLAGRRPQRNLAIYPASAGFELVDELEYLCARSIEPNVFFNPRFLAPAMPRLEDREIRLAVIRDGDEARSRLRLLVPYSIERPSIPLAVDVLRTWSSPFSPLGTPLVDREDPEGIIADFFAMLGRPHLRLPRVFVMPEMRMDGPFAAMLQSLASSRNLPLVATGMSERPYLQSTLEIDDYLRKALRPHHLREFRRLRRRLSESDKSGLTHNIARTAEEVRLAFESFLALEMAGWKGRKRTAMAVDRYWAAFAREAVYRLAERDLCRIHTLVIDGRTIAAIVVFIENGIAYTWKTAYDEAFAQFSPGTLLMLDVTRSHLEDPNILATDSCAVPDHPVMGRIWTERRPTGTFVIGLSPGDDRVTRQAAAQLHLYRETRNLARALRERIRGMIRRR